MIRILQLCLESCSSSLALRYLPLRFLFLQRRSSFLFQKQKLEFLQLAEFRNCNFLWLFTTLKKHYGCQTSINRSDFLRSSFVLLNHSTIIIEEEGF